MVLCVVVATIATSFFGVYSADMQESKIWDTSSKKPAEWGKGFFDCFTCPGQMPTIAVQQSMNDSSMIVSIMPRSNEGSTPESWEERVTDAGRIPSMLQCDATKASSSLKQNILHIFAHLNYSPTDFAEVMSKQDEDAPINLASLLYETNIDGMTPLDLAEKSQNDVLITLYKKMHELVKPSSDEEAVSLHFVKTPPLEEESVEVFSGEKSLFFLHPRRVRSFRLSPNVMNSVRTSYSNTQQNIH